jgi:hypothetical protein
MISESIEQKEAKIARLGSNLSEIRQALCLEVPEGETIEFKNG